MSIVSLHGHEPLRARLRAAARRDALPASILLHGPRGVGKQRVALELGKTLLCGADQGARPCGECTHCGLVLQLAHPDLHWYFPRPRLKDSDASPEDVEADLSDARVERRDAKGLYACPSGSEGLYVATVRALLRQVSLAPALASAKVFIVGDAERMVSQEGADQAANAFLKLLEEPPPRTTIVLTSSEPGALLPTIRSRVVAVRVAPLPEHAVRQFVTDPIVRARLDAAGVAKGDPERVRLAAGAPGRLLANDEQGEGVAAARRLLDAVEGGSRADLLRAAFVLGGSRARGAFASAMDALTPLVHDQMERAVSRGDVEGALRAAKSQEAIERAKEQAHGNVNPQLAGSVLLRRMAGRGEVP